MSDWENHDLNQGYRDALALMTAVDQEDDQAMQVVGHDCCHNCVIHALIAMILTYCDQHQMTVADYSLMVTEGLNL